MRILSYLPQLLLPRLIDAVRDVEADHVQTLVWEDVEVALHHPFRSVLVLDPYTDGTNRTPEIAAILQRFPTAPVLVYTEFTPAAFQALTFLTPYGVYETLLFQVDDHRARFSKLLTRAGTYSLVVRILEELRPKCQCLPLPIADAIADLFRRPHAYTSGLDLVLTSRTPSTTLQRALAEVGLAPPKQLFIAARVLHVVGYLSNPQYTVEQVAEQAGYQHPRILTQHTLAVFGIRPSQLRTISDEEALSVLVAWTQVRSARSP